MELRNIEEIIMLLKNELLITWDDEETEQRLARIVTNAIPTMNFKLGAKIDYNQAGQEQNLFLIYCTYVYNNCAKDFDNNYQSEIYQIRMLHEVDKDEE